MEKKESQEIRGTWYVNNLKEETGVKAGSRTGHSLLLQKDGRIMVLMGKCSSVHDSAIYLYEVSTNTWSALPLMTQFFSQQMDMNSQQKSRTALSAEQQLEQQQQQNVDIERFNYGCVQIKEKVYLVGGEKSIDTSSGKPRQVVFGDVAAIIYQPTHNHFYWQRLPSKGQMEPRRNMAVCALGNLIIIHGGISKRGSCLGDLMSFDTVRNIWTSYDVMGESVGGLAFHQMIGVWGNKESELQAIRDLRQTLPANTTKGLKEQGIYIFGGKDSTNQCDPQVKLISVGAQPIRMSILPSKGPAPEGRFGHSLVHYAPRNVLIVHGGRNDQASQIFQDVHLFDLTHHSWTVFSPASDVLRHQLAPPSVSFTEEYAQEEKAQGGERAALSKCFHASVMAGSKMVVFGGYNFTNLNSNQVYVLEMDPVAPTLLDLQLRTRRLPIGKTLNKKSSQALNHVDSKHTLRRDATSLEIKSIRKGREKVEGNNLTFLPTRENTRKSEWLAKVNTRNQTGYQQDHHMLRHS